MLCLFALTAMGCLLAACRNEPQTAGPVLDPMNPARLKLERTSLVREAPTEVSASPMDIPGWYARLRPPARAIPPHSVVRGFW